MRGLIVFGLSTIGALTLTAGLVGAGAAGLWMWHAKDGCQVMSRRFHVDVDGHRHGSPLVVRTLPPPTVVCESSPAPEVVFDVAPAPLPMPTLAAVAPAGSPRVAALEAELQAARDRIASLEERLLGLLAERAVQPARPAAAGDEF